MALKVLDVVSALADGEIVNRVLVRECNISSAERILLCVRGEEQDVWWRVVCEFAR